MRDLGHREVKQLSQCHRARTWQSWDLNPDTLVPWSTYLTIMLPSFIHLPWELNELIHGKYSNSICNVVSIRMAASGFSLHWTGSQKIWVWGLTLPRCIMHPWAGLLGPGRVGFGGLRSLCSAFWLPSSVPHPLDPSTATDMCENVCRPVEECSFLNGTWDCYCRRDLNSSGEWLSRARQ